MYNSITGKETIYAVTDGREPTLPDNSWNIDEIDNEWSAVGAVLFPDHGLTAAWKSVRKNGGSWGRPTSYYGSSWDSPLSRAEQFLLVRENAIARKRLVQAREDLAAEDEMLAAATLEAVNERVRNER